MSEVIAEAESACCVECNKKYSFFRPKKSCGRCEKEMCTRCLVKSDPRIVGKKNVPRKKICKACNVLICVPLMSRVALTCAPKSFLLLYLRLKNVVVDVDLTMAALVSLVVQTRGPMESTIGERPRMALPRVQVIRTTGNFDDINDIISNPNLFQTNNTHNQSDRAVGSDTTGRATSATLGPSSGNNRNENNIDNDNDNDSFSDMFHDDDNTDSQANIRNDNNNDNNGSSRTTSRNRGNTSDTASSRFGTASSGPPPVVNVTSLETVLTEQFLQLLFNGGNSDGRGFVLGGMGGMTDQTEAEYQREQAELREQFKKEQEKRKADSVLENIENETDIAALRVSQLKEILEANFVDHSACLEKQELLEKVVALWRTKHEEDDDADDADGGLCTICYSNRIDCVFLECGHLVCCTECGAKMSECPMCRRPITRCVHVFRK